MSLVCVCVFSEGQLMFVEIFGFALVSILQVQTICLVFLSARITLKITSAPSQLTKLIILELWSSCLLLLSADTDLSLTYPSPFLLLTSHYVALTGLELLCRPSWPQTHRDPPASQGPGLKAWATMHGLLGFFLLSSFCKQDWSLWIRTISDDIYIQFSRPNSLSGSVFSLYSW